MLKSSKLFVVILLIVGTIFLIGCSHGLTPSSDGSQDPEPQQTSSVTIEDFSYIPNQIEITKGTTVTWTNQDSTIHTVTSNGNFDSGDLGQGEAFSHTFDQSGTLDYTCTYHPNMEGQVIVE